MDNNMNVSDIENVDMFLEELFKVNSNVLSPTLEEFELTFSPTMQETKAMKQMYKEVNKRVKKPNKKVATYKRCPYTGDMIEDEFGDVYIKSKGEY